MTIFINIIYILLLLLPVVVVVFLFRATKPKYYGYLVFGVALIVWAGLSAAQLNLMIQDLKLIINGEFVSEVDTTSMASWQWLAAYLNTWMYIFPGVCAAIGANLITSFITMDKPNS